MPDMMAIVSKAVFEKQAGKSPAVGTVLGMDRYTSANKNLDPLAEGGRLYLVTVRPPDESLWLVAVLDQPAHDGTAWVAAPSTIAITDISDLRAKIQFESGAGITAKPGALGMSLQTPRALTAEDAALLDAAAGGRAPTDESVVSARASSGVRSGGLMAAIFEDPDHVDAQRVYADLLVQQNDPRGELILTAIALDGPLSIRRRAQLSARHAELVEAHGSTWWPYVLRQTRTKHGFLVAVEGSIETISTAARAGLFEREPVTELTVPLDSDEDVAELATQPWLSRIRRLIVRGEVGDDGFAALCKARALGNLRGLNVTSCGITSEGLAALKSAFPKLTTLVLTSNPIGDEGAAVLRKWKHVTGLEVLYVSNCELSSEGVKALLAGGALPALWKLCLKQNELDDDAAGFIAKAAAKLPALRHLELASTGITDDGVTTLQKAKLPALRRIDVRRNDLDTEALTDDARLRF